MVSIRKGLLKYCLFCFNVSVHLTLGFSDKSKYAVRIHSPFTVIITCWRTMFPLFPALLFPTQVYILLAYGNAVGTGSSCWNCWAIGVAGVLPSNHCTKGMGWPVAVQTRSNLVPTVTVCDDSGGSTVTIGASIYN